jgi:hypothetical protein
MAFCIECGTDIGTAKFCGECGTPVAKTAAKTKIKEVKKPSKETDIAEFTDGVGCNVKLTSEKIYAKSVGLEETYALRSVDGAGVFDDMEGFAKEKLEAERSSKSKKNWGIGLMVFFGLGLLGGLIGISQGNSDASGSIGLSAILFALGVYLYNKSKEALEKVKLKSYIKIIISGSNKLYLFDKNAPDSEKVADFLEKVEETLTKYN